MEFCFKRQEGKNMDKAKDMTGKICGRLKVITRAPNDKYGNARWLCLCECGKELVVKGQPLRSGKTKSCGCYHKDVLRAKIKHGESKEILYKRWHAIKSRCTNKNLSSYKDYGGRGINICEEWLDPANFIEWAKNNGYRRDLTIERIDVNGDYSPENCKWVTRAEQNRNTRRNIKQRINGKLCTISEISRQIGMSRSTVLKWYHDEKLRGNQLIERYNKVPERYKNS